MSLANVFDDIPESMSEEITEELANSSHVRIERIVSFGQASPKDFWYDQDTHEWILLLKGAAALKFQDTDEVVELEEGSFLNIEAHRKHRVEWTKEKTPTIWLAIHYS